MNNLQKNDTVIAQYTYPILGITKSNSYTVGNVYPSCFSVINDHQCELIINKNYFMKYNIGDVFKSKYATTKVINILNGDRPLYFCENMEGAPTLGCYTEELFAHYGYELQESKKKLTKKEIEALLGYEIEII